VVPCWKLPFGIAFDSVYMFRQRLVRVRKTSMALFLALTRMYFTYWNQEIHQQSYFILLTPLNYHLCCIEYFGLKFTQCEYVCL